MNFAGIGGSGVSADTVGVVPGYPGYGVGAIEYIAHMMADPKMRIARPRQVYTGYDLRDYVDIDKRG